MTLSIPCWQLKNDQRPRHGEMVDVYVDPMSVDLCLNCTDATCEGAPNVGRQWRGLSCAYERAIAEKLWGTGYVEGIDDTLVGVEAL